MQKLQIIGVVLIQYVGFLVIQSCHNEPVFNNTPNNEELYTPLAICENGFADIYPCNNYNLMSHIPIDSLGGANSSGNDCWGWVDSQTQKEYVLFGTSSGVAFVDISIPNDPVIIGKLPTATINSSWRDVKVFEDHAYIVADNASNHGLQVFDLKKLRTVTNPPETFSTDAHFTQFGSAHNVVINEARPYAYVVGTKRNSSYQGGTIFFDITNPINPVNINVLPGYSHDAQIVVYQGPDLEHVDKELFIGSNENEVVIVDITDKLNPIQIATISYSNVGYTHQGWLTPDHKYFILGDELDEINIGTNTKTVVFDLSDLDNPAFHFNYLGPTQAIDHNGYVNENIFYLANYTAGVRMIDISNIETNSPTEIGYFDTYPEDNTTVFNGVWNVYPYFPSGNIVISDIKRGLFVVKKSN